MAAAHPVAIPKGAKHIVQRFLQQYGLGHLTDWAWGIYTKSGGGQVGMDTINAELPNTAEFKARFPAYHKLAESGRAMSIQQMLDYETTARQIFHAAGVPGGFYDTPKELADFMLHDVSTSELQARVQDASKALIATPPDTLSQLQRLYGVDSGHLTAFFLDPNKAEPLIMQKFTAAQIAAQAQRAGFAQALSTTQAEGLAKLGITDQSASEGFQKLGMNQGLFQQQVTGEQGVTAEQELAAQFGGEGSVAAQQAFEKRKAARLAAFQGNSGFRVGQQGVGGLAPTKQT